MNSLLELEDTFGETDIFVIEIGNGYHPLKIIKEQSTLKSFDSLENLISNINPCNSK